MVGDSNFTEFIYKVVSEVPASKVVSYSQAAIMCGKPGAARRVGQIAHYGPSELPWHRLVKADGSMASGFVPGGPINQQALLVAEGVKFSNDKVIMKDYQL